MVGEKTPLAPRLISPLARTHARAGFKSFCRLYITQKHDVIKCIFINECLLKLGVFVLVFRVRVETCKARALC